MKKRQRGFVFIGFVGHQVVAALIGMTFLVAPPLIGQGAGHPNNLTSASGAIHASNGEVTVKE